MESSENPSSQDLTTCTDDGKQKTETTIINQEPQEAPIDDNSKKPCCSKSLSFNHHHHVRFPSNDTDGEVKKEFIAESRHAPRRNSFGEAPLPLIPLPSTIQSDHPHPGQDDKIDNIRYGSNAKASTASDKVQLGLLGSGFSDSVLTLPGLSEFQHNTTGGEVANDGQQNEKLNDVQNESSGGICEKPPKINLVDQRVSNNVDGEDEDESVYSRHVDENNNWILWPAESKKKLMEHASFIFHKDRRADLERLRNLMPRGREYVVFNVFTDIARMFGYRGRSRKKHVVFPEEFLEKYEQQGDVAGKDRFVPSAKQPYIGLQTSSKKRKLSAVYSTWTIKSAEFAPRVERVDNINKCEFCCEKYCITCDCCGGVGKKQNVRTIMDGYLGDLNIASIFLHGHMTRTFESAMSSLEFIRFHESLVSIMGQTPWSMNYAKQHLGILSGSIWMFTYCIRTIIQQARHPDASLNKGSLPSENSFRKVMEQFSSLCITVSENVKMALQHSHNYYNFCKECIRILKVLQVHIGFRVDIRVNPPLQRGSGLVLNRTLSKSEIVNQKGIDVMVAKSTPNTETEAEQTLEWKNFADLSGNEKASSLRHLLNVTSEGMSMVQAQQRFLLDDIVDSVKDTNEADLLYLLADMYDRIKFLESAGLRRMKPEMELISRTTTEFCNDFQSFANYGQHIMKRYVEFRDMVHLSYEFMMEGLNLETLSEMVPSTTFRRKSRLPGCCGGPKPNNKAVSNHQPKYKPLDFFRVYYMDLVKCGGEVYANKFHFHVDMSKQVVSDIIPTGTDNTWGDMELNSPRMSFEEYVDHDEDDDDMILGTSNDKIDIPLPKPILVSSGSSPRGSIDGAEDDNADDLQVRGSSDSTSNAPIDKK